MTKLKTIQHNLYLEIEINERDDPKYPSRNDSYWLSDIVKKLRGLGISENEWNRIKIEARSYPRSNDTYIYIEYEKAKSSEQIARETEKLQKELAYEEAKKLERKKAREAKKKAKQEALARLDDETKDLLGL